jgi:hypothetical protein
MFVRLLQSGESHIRGTTFLNLFRPWQMRALLELRCIMTRSLGTILRSLNASALLDYDFFFPPRIRWGKEGQGHVKIIWYRTAPRFAEYHIM